MELDEMLAFVTNILPLLTNIKSVDLPDVRAEIMDLWTQNGNELAKRMLSSANVLSTELVFLHPTGDFN
jgi:hypothetical protein